MVVWAAVGRFFRYSENWQLVINTGTTIVTFLMVFLIQQSQNKDSVALHLKLNELLAANELASNRMIGIEDLDEQDLRDVASFYVRLAEIAKRKGACKEVHSIDEEDASATAGGRRPVRRCTGPRDRRAQLITPRVSPEARARPYAFARRRAAAREDQKAPRRPRASRPWPPPPAGRAPASTWLRAGR